MRLTTLPPDPPLGHRRDAAAEQQPPSPPGRRVLAPCEHAEAPERAALAAGLADVRARILAATAAGQPPPQLVAVTKSVSPATALALARSLLAAGDGGAALATAQRSIPVALGESRAADLAAKVECFQAAGLPARWHFLGHVQRNKARRIVALADVVQSLDSLRLAELLQRAAADAGKVLDVFVQVDFTGDEAKTGLDADGAREVLRYVAQASHLRALGLMAMGPLGPTSGAPRPGRSTPEVFARVAALARELEADPALAGVFPGGRVELSLGMSGDLEDAIAAGSTLVRVGSDLFRHLSRDPVPEAPPPAPGAGNAAQPSGDGQTP